MDVNMKARVKPVVVEGDLIDKRFDPKTGEKSLLLAWTGPDKEPHERWFGEGELELVEPSTSAV